MVSMAVNPTASTYPTRSPYVTPNEFKNAGTGIDTTQLVPGGTSQQNAAALIMHLQRASSYADGFCQKVLAATVDTQSGKFRVRHDAWLGPVLSIPLDFTPIIAVSGVQIGWTPSSLVAISDLSNVAINRKTAVIPFAPPGVSSGPVVTGFSGTAYATVTYVNGWANTTLTQAAAAGASSITVASTLGIMPGQQLTLWSTTASEQVTVATTWTPTNTGTNTAVPLAAPVVGSYAVNDVATAMPQDIKTAVILIAKSLIKTRGSDSVVLQSTGGSGGPRESMEPGITTDLGLAEDILERYKRVF